MKRGGENIAWKNPFIKFWHNPQQDSKLKEGVFPMGPPYEELMGNGDFSVPKNNCSKTHHIKSIHFIYIKTLKARKNMLCSIICIGINPRKFEDRRVSPELGVYSGSTFQRF